METNQQNQDEIEIVGINDIGSPKQMAHLLKYDSIYGTLKNNVTYDTGHIIVDGKPYPLFQQKDVKDVDWDALGAQIIIESSGKYAGRRTASSQDRLPLGGSVKKVIITAPSTIDDITIVLGVNEDTLREKISNFFSDAKQFGKNALDSLKQFWSEHGDNVLAVLQWLWQGCVDLTADIVTLGGHLFDLLGGLITGFQTGDWTQFLQGCKELWQDFLDILNGIGRAVFGELWDPLVGSMNDAWNLLKGFFSWFGDKIQWAR